MKGKWPALLCVRFAICDQTGNSKEGIVLDYTLIVKLTNGCNLNCSYCYHRRDSNRDMRHSLSFSDLETMIQNLLQHNEHEAEFIWHGGEPLLTGIDTFKFIVERQKRHNTKKLLIRNSVQTNGTLLDDAYIQFFKENDFSIGISIDGPFDMHTSERGRLHVMSAMKLVRVTAEATMIETSSRLPVMSHCMFHV